MKKRSWPQWRRFVSVLLLGVFQLLRGIWRPSRPVGLPGVLGHVVRATVLVLPIGTVLLLLSQWLDLWSKHRPLNASEMDMARQVFGDGLKLDVIRISTDSWLTELVHRLNGHRPFVGMYTIHACKGHPLDTATFLHELTHVWQAQTQGPAYMVGALWSQWSAAWRSWRQHRRFDDAKAYEVTDDILVKAGGVWGRLNPEQQAVVMAEYGLAVLRGDALQQSAHVRHRWLYTYASQVRERSAGQTTRV